MKGFSESDPYIRRSVKIISIVLGLLGVVLAVTIAWKIVERGQKETCNGEYRTTECLVKLTAKTKAKEDYDKLIKAIDDEGSIKTAP